MKELGMTQRSDNNRHEQGFSIIQLMITVAIIAIVTTFGILGIRQARAETRVQNSTRRFALYVEKARGDSIRRHAAPGSEAFVQTFGEGTNTFNVRMDFDGTGTLQTRTFTLDSGVTFNNVAQSVTFDWRGRIVERLVFQIINSARSLPVDISGSGDVTVNDQVFSDDEIPGITLAEVTNDVVPDATPTPTATPNTTSPTPTPTATPTPTPNGNGNGNGNGNNASPTPTPTPTPTPAQTPTPAPTPTPTPVPPPCASSVSATSLSLSQSISTRRTGTVIFTLTNATGAHTISAFAAGSGNPLTLSISPASFNGNGYSTVTIGSKTGNGNRGTFTVNISATPSCGIAQRVTVSVGN
jgi:hypothetical protein